MGCGSSRGGLSRSEASKWDCVKEDDDLKLSYSKILYSSQQLFWLNEKFAKLVESTTASETLRKRQSLHVGVVVERLIQRLICNVGTIDPRFSSKFLINLQSLHDQPVGKNLRFRYLIRLDGLSTPALYPEHFEPPVRVMEGTGIDHLPHGYVKVRVHGEYLEQWSDFINSGGYLRRDKIQERFIDLLARAAARPTEPSCPTNVDESVLCGSPGKIVDPITLYHILKLPSSQHVFYGAAECNESRFPDPRDFRIAIVEGTPETRLHISFLSPTAQTLIGEGDVEIVLVLGIGVTGWPVTTDYPSRYPLDHVDVILGYQSAQMDYYVVPKGPPLSVRCEDRTTLWEIRALPTEMFLEYHYSPNSAIGRIFKILPLILVQLRSRGVKTINRYIMKNLIFYELENKKRIEQWMPKSISRRVLSILDNLLSGLRNQSLPCYFFKRKNILLQDNALEEDYVSDGDILEHYLRQLSQDGTKWSENGDKCQVTVKDQLENVMLEKWTNVVSNLLPPVSNRGRRLSVPGGSLASVSYTRRQMEYVALLFREILKLKHIQQRQTGRELPSNGKQADVPEEVNAVEDVIFLLQIVFTQAKQRIYGEVTSMLGSKSCDANRKKFKLTQLIRSYEVSTSMIMDDLRRNKETNYHEANDMNLVSTVIECLYKATDSDGRVLSPILRPYLNQLFRGSHENCWFIPEWKKKMEDLEFQAIGAFSSLVVTGGIDPLCGILDSAKKGWNWAKSCMRIMQSIKEENSASVIMGDKIDTSGSGLRMIFTPAPGDTIRYVVSPPRLESCMMDEDLTESTFSTIKSTCPRRRNRVNSYATIRSFSGDVQPSDKGAVDERRESTRSSFEKQPPHAKLRDENPFTGASMEARRRGSHRGLGSIVQALISLQKLTVLQEISHFLPQEEKRKVLNDIKKLSKEVERLTVSNYRRRNLPLASTDRGQISKKEIERMKPKWRSATLPGKIRNFSQEIERGETYRSVNEFAILTESENKEYEPEVKVAADESLLGTCRLLRKHERQRIIGAKAFEPSPGTGRFRKGISNSSTINTPFYLKVTTYDNTTREHQRLRRHTTDFMQF